MVFIFGRLLEKSSVVWQGDRGSQDLSYFKIDGEENVQFFKCKEEVSV